MRLRSSFSALFRKVGFKCSRVARCAVELDSAFERGLGVDNASGSISLCRVLLKTVNRSLPESSLAL